jgi:ubiquinone/menaquinone biosynthesis C-methylase UbiE
VTHQAKLDRLLLGLRGLTLLRGWPMGNEHDADEQIQAMRGVLNAPSPSIEIADLGLGPAYEQWAPIYDDGPNGLIVQEERVVKRLLATLPAGRALDAACGTGRIALLLAESGHQVVGVDASSAMLAKAASKGLSGRLALGDLGSLPITSLEFDLVVCSLALAHETDLRRPIAELARVVKPGGHVLISDIHPVAAVTGAQALIDADDGTKLLARNHVHWADEYVDAFTDADLQVLRLEEPRVEEAVFEQIPDPAVKEATLASLIGLPFAIVWLTSKT